MGFLLCIMLSKWTCGKCLGWQSLASLDSSGTFRLQRAINSCGGCFVRAPANSRVLGNRISPHILVYQVEMPRSLVYWERARGRDGLDTNSGNPQDRSTYRDNGPRCESPRWPLLVDAEQWPLLTDTGKWGAVGVDLGANTEHNGRTYIFFGDVATSHQSGIALNADMVAWIDDPEVLLHGGHLALGWNFILPFEPTSVQGQPDWRFCGKCGSLFWDGDPAFKGFCHRDQGIHEAIGLRFVIPCRGDRRAGWSTELAFLWQMRRTLFRRRSCIQRHLS